MINMLTITGQYREAAARAEGMKNVRHSLNRRNTFSAYGSPV